ncbi:MAG TPA: hypothetical protein VE953_18145 [Terriglobales bacterium]|nr:hypothetical protein [Terriglobales bacterium]
MTGPRALRHVLLLLQGALAGLVALETLVVGVALRSPLLLWLAALAIALAVVPVVLAFGLLRGRRRARGLTVAYEMTLLVSGCVNATLLGNDDLVSLLVTLALPLVVLWLLGHYPPELQEPSERPA